MYSKIATKYNVAFIDASKIVTVGSDGVHLDEENNRKLALEIEKKISKLS